MNKEIAQAIGRSTRLHHIHDGLVAVFKDIKKADPSQRIGVVSGIISSDGDEHISENIERLARLTDGIGAKYEIPVFSTNDVFGNGMYDQIEEFTYPRELREEHFVEFWRMVLSAGYITDIFMTQRWDESNGARDEHETARKIGLKIHYMDDKLNEIDG